MGAERGQRDGSADRGAGPSGDGGGADGGISPVVGASSARPATRALAPPGPVRLGAARLHPLLTTVPIGAFACALAFDVASRTVETYVYARGAMWLSLIGLASAVVAGAVGTVDGRRRVRPGSPPSARLRTHVLANVGAVLAFTAGMVLRRRELDSFLAEGSPVPVVGLSALGVALIVTAAVAGDGLGATLDRRDAELA